MTDTNRTGVAGNKVIQAVPGGTPFSQFYPAVLNCEWAKAEAMLAENVVWTMMPNNQILKDRNETMAFIKASVSAAQREPAVMGDVFLKEWGVWEYWNIGTVTNDLVGFVRASGWPLPNAGQGLAGKRYKVGICFVYHVNASGHIDLVREYLDVGTVIAQLR